MTAISTQYRRPSQARIRKSISKRSREVTWCPTEETVHEIESYDGIDHALIWFSREELQDIRHFNEFTVESECENEDETMRGLEFWTDEGGWERFQHHSECMNRVLDEQDRQRGIDKTEFQQAAYPIVKRVNHMHIAFDHNRLGALCRDATARARRAALLRGRKDANAIKEEKPAKVQQLSVKALCKKFEQATDNDTVQTAFLTNASSYEGALPEDETLPPLPSIVSCVITPESLKAKHDARFARYLANRQQRIEAQLQADYEWEQRRLARRAVLCGEYDEHLEKMHSLIRATNELIELVSTRRA